MSPRNTRKATKRRGAFTLIELVFVMLLLATMLAFAAPSLSRSMRQRHLKDEATRLLALTEYARAEAISQGVPMTLWVDANARRFGVSAKTGFTGDARRQREYALDPEIALEIEKVAPARGITQAVEFAPDGALDSASTEAIHLSDATESAMTLARTRDGWGYEIVKEAQ